MGELLNQIFLIKDRVGRNRKKASWINSIESRFEADALDPVEEAELFEDGLVHSHLSIKAVKVVERDFKGIRPPFKAGHVTADLVMLLDHKSFQSGLGKPGG